MPSKHMAKLQLRMWLNLWESWEEKEIHNLKHEEQTALRKQYTQFYKQSFICILKWIGKIVIIFS
jgi:uncharacterized protein YnzC (UPF0291/DUF896 family)